MDSLDQALVRAVIDARLAAAEQRRLAREATRARRAARPGPHRPRPRWPWRRPAPVTAPAPAPTALHVAPAPAAVPTDVALSRILDDLSEDVAEHGTGSQRRMLAEVAAATRTMAPGAAAALVDRHGSEVARLRALGLLHGVARNELSSGEQARLLARLQGDTGTSRTLVA